MNKKLISLILSIMICIISTSGYSFADEKGKVIFLSMNRTNFNDLIQIDSLKAELYKRGYVGLMNTRGDQGNDDRRSYATMGSGRRSSVSSQANIDFVESTETNDEIYFAKTGEEPKYINDLQINLSIRENENNGQYGATLGSFGQTLVDNNISSAIIGNSDKMEDGEVIPNRNLGLFVMDYFGRIEDGNIEDINILDNSMPYGIRTDYEKLFEETKKYYEEKDIVFVELGDTYRFDEYDYYLNENSYQVMKDSIYEYIDGYISNVLELIDENDILYIVSPFYNHIDSAARRRLAPVIKFDGDGKGLLTSTTTRREGVVANLDIGRDILNEFDLENVDMVGRSFEYIEKNKAIEYLDYELEKMATISINRANFVNTFVGVVTISWILGALLVLFRKKIPRSKEISTILKEFIKLGLIMPLALLVAPIFNFNEGKLIGMAIVFVTIFFYLLSRMLFKNDDIKQMGFLSTITMIVIVIDSMNGTYLMSNNIMSYDAIVGARYYGIGNEYEGVTIACAVFAMSVLVNYNKLPRWSMVLLSIIILITSAFPSMGANVGGAISECVAYLLFILLIFDVKLDLKKVIMIGVLTVLVVCGFAALDFLLDTQSHLSLFVSQILNEGPSAIIETFSRKIQMNLKLAQTSVWANILLVGVLVIASLIFKPKGHFMQISEKYPVIFKGFVASMVGCITTLLVNDSGIVAAATASIYILIPILIISMDMMCESEGEN
ncbi:MAG: hypothetical protein R3Y64_00790 [Peptostreptococcaceae bacterium]